MEGDAKVVVQSTLFVAFGSSSRPRRRQSSFLQNKKDKFTSRLLVVSRTVQCTIKIVLEYKDIRYGKQALNLKRPFVFRISSIIFFTNIF